MKFDPMKDYMQELKEDEVVEKDGGGKLVYLKGLERLARERGITQQTSQVVSAPSKDNPYATVTVGYEFRDAADDGGFVYRTYQASADASDKNCEGNFKLYPVAMAESRAKARALRNAFGISACSVEEVKDIDEVIQSPPCSDPQQYLIKKLLKEKNVSLSDAGQLISIANLKDIQDLNRDEASKLIGKLQKVK